MFKFFKYPQYRILEKTDQYGAKVFVAQVRKSFFGEDIIAPLSPWRSLSLVQGVAMDWSFVCDDNNAVFSYETAENIIQIAKKQDAQRIENKLIEDQKQKAKQEAEKLIPKFKITNKTYL